MLLFNFLVYIINLIIKMLFTLTVKIKPAESCGLKKNLGHGDGPEYDNESRFWAPALIFGIGSPNSGPRDPGCRLLFLRSF